MPNVRRYGFTGGAGAGLSADMSFTFGIFNSWKSAGGAKSVSLNGSCLIEVIVLVMSLFPIRIFVRRAMPGRSR